MTPLITDKVARAPSVGGSLPADTILSLPEAMSLPKNVNGTTLTIIHAVKSATTIYPCGRYQAPIVYSDEMELSSKTCLNNPRSAERTRRINVDRDTPSASAISCPVAF